MTNAVCTYDFTVPAEGEGDTGDREWLDEWLEEYCKKWSYQLERGDSGYLHYQGRCSLGQKKRLGYVVKNYKPLHGIHWSITSNECKGDMFYVTKEDTRVLGPWKDTDHKIHVPRDIRRIKQLRPWQEELMGIMMEDEDRCVYILYDPVGNSGKSIFARYMQVHGHAQQVPPLNDNKDIMQLIMCMEESRAYIMDMPRCMNKDRLYGVYSAIETLKSGWVYDTRYKFKQRLFDPPTVLVFTNVLPDRGMLSKDRWVLYMIGEDKQLLEMDWDAVLEEAQE